MKTAMAVFVSTIVLGFAVPTRAEIVLNLHYVKLRIGNQALTGYLALPYRDDLDLSSPEGLSFVRGLSSPPSLYSSLDETAPFSDGVGPFKFTTKAAITVENKKVTAITPLHGDFDDTEPGAIATVSVKDAKLLKTAPTAWCKSQIWDGDYWLSYNFEVTAKDLGNLCNRDFAHKPSDVEQQAVLKKGRVVHFTYPAF